MLMSGLLYTALLSVRLQETTVRCDKLWSLTPIVYAWIIADYGGYSPRLVLIDGFGSVMGIQTDL